MKRAWSARLALAIIITSPSLAQAQRSADERLLRRIDSLELRIQELERRISQLESSTKPVSERPKATVGNAREIANWRRLRERMTFDDVRGLLGEPERVNGGSVTWWYYPNSGSVTFISGRLTDWSEPSP